MHTCFDFVVEFCDINRAGGRTPRTPRSGGASRMLRGLMLRRRAVLGTPKCEKNLMVAGAPPRTPLGELTALPQTPSWWGGAPRGLCCPLPKNPTYNIVIVIVLCVCTHVYENALLFSFEC